MFGSNLRAKAASYTKPLGLGRAAVQGLGVLGASFFVM